MPTPRPIIIESWIETVGTSMRAAAIVISDTPTPRLKRAATIGRPMATAEPNAMSRITIAATTPTISDDPLSDWSLVMGSVPPSSTSMPAARAGSTAASRSSTASLPSSPGCSEYWMVE